MPDAERLDLTARPRRLRRLDSLRRLVAETRLSVDSLVYPIFIEPGSGIEQPIDAMPGQSILSPDRAANLARTAAGLGIPAVLLFGRPRHKDDTGSDAHAADGAVQEAIRRIKDAVPNLTVITDVCLCAYTSHGHCGILDDESIDNDRSVAAIARVALSHAEAGADLVAPSDMMDGRVGAIRAVLDDAGHPDTAILAYAAKYASAFYGPFREAADSAPAFGDRRSYQMDPPNIREALREIELDIAEGADIVMVKPALAYLDVIAAARRRFDLPLAAYNVSGEYAMVKAAVERGWIDEQKVVTESLTAIARAGAGIIVTYWALDFARWQG
ncbi:MAG: porphobilinogen synthase [Chloroflexota bacterium]|jgi:porphobilinogen synthase|nr:porphobilinogen synthase [Chloroflexota bacterium]MDP6509147.1 porphobilinogen synthase [Chloroflexota bacterium]MDP6757936.1 porphobilinogen synthase [Chloroflexota bacterium]